MIKFSLCDVLDESVRCEEGLLISLFPQGISHGHGGKRGINE